MENMFSRNTDKNVPKTLKDCYKTDSITENLWSWCIRLENWGKILFWILIVGGLILAITSSIVEKEVVIKEATMWSSAETELRKTFDFGIFFSLAIDTALYAFLEYCAYHIIALLVGSLARIVQNTKVAADVAIYNAAKEEKDDSTPENEKNESYLSRAAKEVEKPIRNNNSVASSSKVWVCKKCGEKNSSGMYCKSCGEYK